MTGLRGLGVNARRTYHKGREYRGRTYPVDLKPPSNIRSWSGWPEDVVETLQRWNRGHDGHKLSFGSQTSLLAGFMLHPSEPEAYAGGVFKCPDCGEFCIPQPLGTCVLDGDPICDECIIIRVRAL